MTSKKKKSTKKAVTLPVSGKKYMTQADYAEAREVTPPRISKLIKEGVIILVAGTHKGRKHKLVDIKQADKAIAETQSPAHNDNRKFSGSTVKPNEVNPTSPAEALTFQEATTKEKVAKAKLAELELKEKEGTLVPVADVISVWSDQIASTKTRLRSIPTKTSQKIIHHILNSVEAPKLLKGKSERELIVEVEEIQLAEIDETLEGLSNEKT